MTYLEIDIICSIFFLFLKYSSHPMIAVFFLTRYIIFQKGVDNFKREHKNMLFWLGVQ